MQFTEAIKLAIEAIWANKLRSFLTLLGVIFGVATVIVVVSLIEGFNKYVDEKIANIGTNAFSVQKFSIEDFSSLDNYEQARRRNKDVTMDDLVALRARLGDKIKEVGAQEQDQCESRVHEPGVYGAIEEVSKDQRHKIKEQWQIGVVALLHEHDHGEHSQSNHQKRGYVGRRRTKIQSHMDTIGKG